MHSNSTFDAVFFDLDGTILDTAPDLMNACNAVLREYCKPEINFTEFRRWVHGGTNLMINNSFNITNQDPEFSKIKSTFIDYYQQQSTHKTQFFAGIEATLDFLDSQSVPWGIVTNKPSKLTHPILAHFGLEERCCCIISGDTLTQSKPHPAPLLHACYLISCLPHQSIYVGDTEGDIQAAKAAGMMSIAVRYGYHPQNSQPSEWNADALIEQAHELIPCLFNWRRKE